MFLLHNTRVNRDEKSHVTWRAVYGKNKELILIYPFLRLNSILCDAVPFSLFIFFFSYNNIALLLLLSVRVVRWVLATHYTILQNYCLNNNTNCHCIYLRLWFKSYQFHRIYRSVDLKCSTPHTMFHKFRKQVT